LQAGSARSVVGVVSSEAPFQFVAHFPLGQSELIEHNVIEQRAAEWSRVVSNQLFGGSLASGSEHFGGHSDERRSDRPKFQKSRNRVETSARSKRVTHGPPRWRCHSRPPLGLCQHEAALVIQALGSAANGQFLADLQFAERSSDNVSSGRARRLDCRRGRSAARVYWRCRTPRVQCPMRWYRRLVATKYDGSKTRRPGRPSTKPDIAALVVRMATENPTWGYTRIRGGLKSLGHEVARNTIKAILKDHGIEPAPSRGTKTSWKTFLAAHRDGLAAADFFTVEVLTMRGLVRYVVLFVLKLRTRTVEIAGITSHPDEVWMTQVARNLTDAHEGFLRGVQHVILDRDPLYTVTFRRLLRDSGVKSPRLPARSPNLNAFAERFVGSVRAECLDRMVLFGEGHFRAAVREFVHHYHEERPHQGLGNERIAPTTTLNGTCPVRCRDRLGGLLKFYYREAA
jgi:putative transposase